MAIFSAWTSSTLGRLIFLEFAQVFATDGLASDTS